MTSQTEKTIDELRDEAKKIGIKGAHNMKEETLKARLGEAQTDKPAEERKKAPRMSVSNLIRDDRKALIDRLEAENPEFKYMFMSAKISDQDIEAKGLERTEHKLKNDIVCRTMKDSYYEVLEAERKFEYDNMQNIDGGTGIIDTHTEMMKIPRQEKS